MPLKVSLSLSVEQKLIWPIGRLCNRRCKPLRYITAIKIMPRYCIGKITERDMERAALHGISADASKVAFLAHFASCTVAGGRDGRRRLHPPTHPHPHADRPRARTQRSRTTIRVQLESIGTRRGCRGITPRRRRGINVQLHEGAIARLLPTRQRLMSLVLHPRL